MKLLTVRISHGDKKASDVEMDIFCRKLFSEKRENAINKM